MRRAAVLMLLAPLLGLPAPSLARAEYTHASLVSYEGDEIAEDAYSPAISADGDYVAFAGTFNGVSGVWRKDPQTGELALVAGADESDPALSAPDAGSPSISESGQYVSFTTTARLDPVDDQPGDTGGCSSVYVRNMGIPAGQPGAYILASALNGTAQGISYAGSDKSGCPGGGSASADRVALSGNGQQVAFTVLGESDLSTGPSGAIGTPAGQVAVRDLQTDTTTLVSQTMSSLGSTPEAVKGGAALAPADGDLTDNEGQQISGSTAAISADGSTVAWMGVDIGLQALSSLAPSSGYDEPLWRRIGEGPDAPIRRVTGGDDPLCGCQGPLDTGFSASQEEGAPVAGVFSSVHALGGGAAGLSLDEVTPQLSANGQEVAFLSNKPRTGEVSRALEEEERPPSANAYVVDMAPGLTRSQALTPLTEWASDKFSDFASTGAVTGIAISPDGTRVAFTTNRTEFPLTPPALVTPQLSQTEFAQLYVANLSAGTLEMASYGYDEEPSNGGILTPSFTGSGETLAYTSAATNLVYGAFNLGGAVSAEGSTPGNVFTTSLVSSPAVAGQTSIGAAPAGLVPAQSWELLLSDVDGPNGSETVYVTVPGAGSLKALARAEVPITVKTAKTKKAKKTSAAKKTETTSKSEAGKAKQAKAGKAKRPEAKKPAKAADPHETVATETVASASASPAGAGLVALRLTPPGKYRSLLEGHDGLYATITVTFNAPGHSAITGTLQLTFRYETPKKKKPGSKTVKSKTPGKKTSKASSVGRS